MSMAEGKVNFPTTATPSLTSQCLLPFCLYGSFSERKASQMNRRLFFRVTLILSGALLLGGLLLFGLRSPVPTTAAPAQTYRYVYNGDGVDTGPCTDKDHPCKTISYALGQAQTGDVIRVGSGTYIGTIHLTRSVTLEGGWRVYAIHGYHSWTRWRCDPSYTTLDGQGAGRVLEITGPITPVVDCFIITGGNADGLGGTPDGDDAGGGIYVREAAPLIVNNVITGNYGCRSCTSAYGRGGGLYLRDVPATAVISHNQILHNVADEGTWGIGGGILLEDSDAQVITNTIERNRAGHSAGYGGGVAVKGGSPLLQDNLFRGNVAGQSVQGLGGGLYVQTDDAITVENNRFRSNTALSGMGDSSLASRGGGFFYEGRSEAYIRDNLFTANIAAPSGPTGEGGALYLHPVSGMAIVERNRIEENYAGYNRSGDGGGLYLEGGAAQVLNNRLKGNIASWAGSEGTGGALYAENASLLLQGNVISANFGGGFTGSPATTYGAGGGVALSQTTAVLMENEFWNNGATNAANTGGAGGALYAYQSHLPLVSGNLFRGNYASTSVMASGGALYLQESDFVLDRNLILDNAAMGTTYGRGGGVRIALCSPFTLTNNVVARNRASEKGSGIAILASNGALAHNTIAQNYEGVGVGIEIEGGRVALTNTILVSHVLGLNVNDSSSMSANVTMVGTLWGAGAWSNATDHGGSGSLSIGGANLWQLPGFVAPAQWNYHLSADAPALDMGVDGPLDHDLDGDPRPVGSHPDLGADEMSCAARVNGTTYRTIQAAIEAAPTGGTVQVAEGTCYESLAITRSLTLEGGWRHDFSSRYADPAEHTTVDALGHGRVVSITNAGTVRLDGFTFTGGDATGLGGSGAYGYDMGGGIYGWMSHITLARDIITHNLGSASTIAWGGGAGFYGGSALITETVVAGNVAASASNGYGGGLYFRGCPAQIVSTTVRDNVASTGSDGRGGGIAFHFTNHATILHSLVEGNRAATDHTGYGGGIFAYYLTLQLEDSEVRLNAADERYSGGQGGGLYAAEHSAITARRTRMYRNHAIEGGALYLQDSRVDFEDGTMEENGSDAGGGFYLKRSEGEFGGTTFDHNDAIGWSIGVAEASHDLRIAGSTFTRHNSEGALLYLNQCERTVVEDNEFRDNAGSSSLLGITGSHRITVVDNRFIGNHVVVLFGQRSDELHLLGNLFQENDEAVNLHQSGFITLTGNTAISNSAEGAGACLYAQESHDLWIEGFYCVGNRADGKGGGIALHDITGTLRLVNNILARNDGIGGVDGLYLNNVEAHLLHNTLAEQKIGLQIEAGRAWLTNTIIVSHTTAGVEALSGTDVTLAATLWGSGAWANASDWTGSGSVAPGTGYWDAPQFLGERYHLGPHSPAIDRGLPTDVSVDIDGDPRPRGEAPDLGADEVNAPLFLPLVLRGYH